MTDPKHRRIARQLFLPPLALHGVGRKQAAAAADVTKAQWSRIENGAANLPAEVLIAQPVEVQVEMVMRWAEMLGLIKPRAVQAAAELEQQARRTA